MCIRDRDKNHDQTITTDEFIKVFLSAEEILLSKIKNTRKYLENYRKEQAEAKRKLQEAQQTERTNSFGIMENSMLSVEIKDLQLNQQPNSGSTLICQISVGEQVDQTQATPISNPTWNESFTFQIETGMETLDLQLVTSGQEPLGQLSLPLNSFQDQTVHSELLQLRGGKYICGINFQAQWIHSRKQFLQDVVLKWDEQIKVAEEDQKDFEQDLSIIYQPFSGMMSAYHQQFDGNAPQRQYQQINALNSGFDQQQPRNSAPIDNENDEGLLPVAKRFFQNNTNYLQFFKIALFTILSLSLLLFFYKFAILDIIICILTIDTILKGQLIPGKPFYICLLYTSPSPRDRQKSRMPSSA
eukprot:TRINITY_DN6512_c0_g1_i1.p1 TRINITY_DN6512_c0_g1~~TRINITY_DN6512_c0_g1_i1.p1  ORF type:complete len:357 (+),score=27.34 TRINITY_DN6512_c0_g1_i1:142-1212(+)